MSLKLAKIISLTQEGVISVNLRGFFLPFKAENKKNSLKILSDLNGLNKI